MGDLHSKSIKLCIDICADSSTIDIKISDVEFDVTPIKDLLEPLLSISLYDVRDIIYNRVHHTGCLDSITKNILCHIRSKYPQTKLYEIVYSFRLVSHNANSTNYYMKVGVVYNVDKDQWSALG